MNTLSVPCMECKSEVGEHCCDGQGDYVGWVHTSRNLRALSLDPEQLADRMSKLENRVRLLEMRTSDATGGKR